MDTSKLEKYLIAHEGYRQFPYEDSLGYLTIGIGRCLDAKKGPGISFDEALYLLRNEVQKILNNLSQYDWYQSQDDVRKCVLIELAYNMGIGGLLTFKKMLTAMASKSYKAAAQELKDSLWYEQVGADRAGDIIYRIVQGAYRT